MNLSNALRVDRSSRVAFVGAGGKTTGLFQLARSLEPPVVVTCSTHLGAWQAELADHHLVLSRPEDVERFAGQVEGVTLMTGAAVENERLQGLDLEMLAAVSDAADRLGFPVLVEADGSRKKPLKSPGEHEPAIPGWINMVVVVVGLNGLNQPLDSSTVHRPERFSEITGLAMGDAITEQHIASLLEHTQGGLKNIPESAKKVALINQADEPEQVAAGMRIARTIKTSFDAVIISSMSEQRIWRVVEPTAGIILAGGRSSRFGQPKMLLNWNGKPLIRHAAEAALEAGLIPVVVVTGAIDQPVRQALSGLAVTFIHNASWEQGQSTSVQAGLSALAGNIGGAIFLLADQPLVPPDLLRELAERHASTLAAVVAPRVNGQRVNPVLFDREAFPRLMELVGDTGGRAILDQYKVEYVDWGDGSLLLDIDTPDDFARLQGMG